MPLSTSQQSTMVEIINYGLNHGYTNEQIQVAVNVAYIESSMGDNLDNPDSTASGVYQYLDGSWDAYYSDVGDKDDQSNQIDAFYQDLDKYADWYNNPDTNSNIPGDVSASAKSSCSIW